MFSLYRIKVYTYLISSNKLSTNKAPSIDSLRGAIKYASAFRDSRYVNTIKLLWSFLWLYNGNKTPLATRPPDMVSNWSSVDKGHPHTSPSPALAVIGCETVLYNDAEAPARSFWQMLKCISCIPAELWCLRGLNNYTVIPNHRQMSFILRRVYWNCGIFLLIWWIVFPFYLDLPSGCDYFGFLKFLAAKTKDKTLDCNKSYFSRKIQKERNHGKSDWKRKNSSQVKWLGQLKGRVTRSA